MKRPAHEQRVIDERSELVERLGKLKVFLSTDTCLGLPFALALFFLSHSFIPLLLFPQIEAQAFFWREIK